MYITSQGKKSKKPPSNLREVIDLYLENEDSLPLRALAEKSLKDFLEDEPGLYSIQDIKVKVNPN